MGVTLSDGGTDAGDGGSPSSIDAAIANRTSDAGNEAAAGDDAQSTIDGGAGASDDASDGGADALPPLDSGLCNAIANTAPVVSYVALAGPAPVAHGGVLTPGTYYVTQANVYEPDGGPSAGTTIQYTFLLTGGPTTFEYQLALSLGAGDEYGGGTMTTSGSTLTNDDLCNGGGGGNPYSTDTTDAGVVELRIQNLFPNANAVVEYVAQRQ